MAGLTRRTLLQAAALAALPGVAIGPTAARAAPDAKHLWGVNLAGADFGKLLGVHGTEYLYPTPEIIAYYAELGFKLVRVPFKWERLQPEPGAPLAEAELSLLTGVVDEARRHGLTVVLDAHNYARRRLSGDGWGGEFVIGSPQVPLAGFLDFWRRLAGILQGRDDVIFGLMNEPFNLPAADWLDIANATIAAIRAEGARNTLLVPGTAYTGAHSWVDAGNTVMAGVKDPASNFAIEVHQYLDHDSSGTKSTAVSGTVGSERLGAFQSWARKAGIRAFLGEYNSGRDPLSLRALMDLCDEIDANSDVWMGSAAWAGGPRWPDDDIFNLEPYRDGTIREQTAIIQSRARPGMAKRYWTGATMEVYVDFARALALDDMPPHSVLRAEVARESKTMHAPGGPGISLQSAMLADGALAAMFDRPDFTILLEFEGLAVTGAPSPLLRAGDARLLYCTAKCELATDLGGGMSTVPQPPGRLRGKRRYALSISAATGAITIGVTGARPVSGNMTQPLAAVLGPERRIRVGAGPDSKMGGTLRRVVGFSAFQGQDALGENIA